MYDYDEVDDTACRSEEEQFQADRENYIEEVVEHVAGDLEIEFEGKTYHFDLEAVAWEYDDEDDTYDIDVRYECDEAHISGVYGFSDLEFGCSAEEAAEDLRDTLYEWIEID